MAAEAIILEALSELKRNEADGVPPYLQLCMGELLAVRSQVWSLAANAHRMTWCYPSQ
jgi:hypothetical protein